MKKSILYLNCILLLFPLVLTGQQKLSIDKIIEQSAKSNNIEHLNKFRGQLAFGVLDSLSYYSNKLIAMGDQYKAKKPLIYGYLLKSFFFYRKNEFVKMQKYLFKANHLLEKYPDYFLQGLSYQYMSYLQPTVDLYIFYNIKAVKEYQKVAKNSLLSGEEYVAYTNISRVYSMNGKVDSAYVYNQKAEKLILSKHKSQDFMTWVYSNYSTIYINKGKFKLANIYADRILKMAKKNKTVVDIERGLLAKIIYHDIAGEKDSVYPYVKKLYELEGKGFYLYRVMATKFLYEYYAKKKDLANELKYAKEYIAGKDVLEKLEATDQVTKISLLEKQRQDENERQLLKEKEEKANTLQLIFIAIGILTFFIFYLILSRNFIVSPKVIETLGVIVLLIFFEFINLLLHGFIAEITHHSSILMLLFLVVLALIIVPIHHRLEKWVTHKLIRKNKEIRLARAQRNEINAVPETI